MDTDLTQYIVGALVAAIAGGLGYVYRKRTERRQLLNQALFDLLGIWHVVVRVARLQADDLLDVIRKYVAARYPGIEFPTTEQMDVLRSLIEENLDNLLLLQPHRDQSTLQARYDQSVRRIAGFDPLLAYRLSKNQSVQAILDFLDDYVEAAQRTYALESQTARQQEEQLLEAFRQFFIADTLDTLEDDIIRLAYKCGLWKWVKVKIKVRRSRWENRSFEKVLDKYFDHLETSLA